MPDQGPPAPNPRIVVGSLAAIIAVQGIYAAVEILGDGVDPASPWRVLAAVGFAVYAALIVVVIVGVAARRSWAWSVAVIAVCLGLALSGLQILAGDPIGQHGLGLLIDAGLLVYLFRPNIRGMFRA